LDTTPIAELELNSLTQKSTEMFLTEGIFADELSRLKGKIKTLVLKGDLIVNLIEQPILPIHF